MGYDILTFILMVFGILYHEEKKRHESKDIKTYHSECGINIPYGYGTLSCLPNNPYKADFMAQKPFVYIMYENVWYATKFDTTSDFLGYMEMHPTKTENDLLTILTNII